MLPHVQTWLPTGTIVDAGALAGRDEGLDLRLNAYPDPDSWFAGGLSRDNKLPSLLDYRIAEFSPNSKQARRRLRFLDEVPRDAKRHLAGFYMSNGLLSKEVAHRLSRFPVKEIERIERVWLSIEDSLLLSSPEVFLEDEGDFVKTIFRWVVSKMVTSGYEVLLKDYKAWTQFIKTRAIKANVVSKGVPHFPGFTPEGVYTWCNCKWLDGVIRRGLKSKGEATRVAHLTSTRGLPPPTGEMIQGALAKHRALLAAPAADISPERMQTVRLLAKRIGKRVQRSQVQQNLQNPEHVSLTNSSSFAYTRTDGGRAAEVQQEFGLWAESHGVPRTHVLGLPIEQGVNWLSVIVQPRSEDLSMYAFGDPLEGTIVGDRRAGYDSNLGYQILQCAAEAGIKREILDERYNVVGYPHVRASVSSEPGGKARIVTANEWWVTILLQPLGHVLTSLLEEIPSARAGLSRAEPAWEWAQDLQRSKDPSTVDRLYESMELLTSDLSEATDHCHRDLSRQMMEGFFEGMNIHTDVGYLKMAIDLLVCRKMLHSNLRP
uniref:RNA-dependent RNA polymerase n=1 Tax=Zhangzhou Narna tick virus 4 TaxID=2972250 RepID=A0A9E7V205_9VIRU|nr:MAG: RNA-dependent RNA polymerase [Zhangzhou Narna tick virus 4]